MSEREISELRVRVAAAWMAFDKLVSEVEAMGAQTTIRFGKVLEDARKQQAELKKLQALVKSE